MVNLSHETIQGVVINICVERGNTIMISVCIHICTFTHIFTKREMGKEREEGEKKRERIGV